MTRTPTPPGSGPDASPPIATIVIPMRNEQEWIGPCLDSVLANRVPGGEFEVLVVDGESDDDSAALVAAIAQRDPRVRLLRNPRRIQAAAFNLALEQARGSFLLRVDAHTKLPPDYLERCLEVLERTGAANAGGPVIATGTGPVGEAIAAAYHSPFGLGHWRHDGSRTEHDVDSVSFGAFRVAALRTVGGMDPALSINEDFELNHRLRRAGHRVIWNPAIRSTYVVRSSLGRLTRQYLRYGFWKVRTLVAHPGSLRWRQVVAPTFILSLLATPLLVTWLGAWGAVHLLAYALVNLLASCRLAARTSWRHLPLLPLVFLLIHACWGVGFLAGLGYWPLRGVGGKLD